MSWYRELPQSQRLLMVAIHKRVTVTELAVLTILVNQSGRMGVRVMSDLWNGGLLDYRDRHGADYPLPYTRAGIWKAVNALEARGWLQKVFQAKAPWLSDDREPELRVLPINILAEAPPWLRPGEAADGRREAAATPVDPTAGSATSSAGKRQGKGRYSYTLREKGGKRAR